MKTLIIAMVGILTLSSGVHAQSEIEIALTPAPSRAQDAATVIKWNADHSYETLREGSNHLVCYDRSDERARRASRSVHQLVENGEHEGGGLTAAGRCAGEKVTSLKRGWDRLCLNGGGVCEAEIVDTAKKLRVER